MPIPLDFDPYTFQALIGGLPVLEGAGPQVESLAEARSFVESYGYNLESPQDVEKLWLIHARSVIYLRTRILKDEEEIPEILTDQKQLEDPSKLLLYASRSQPDGEIRRWACVLLKVMHVVTHLQNDLFSDFSSDIQEQIFKPYRQFVRQDPALGLIMGGGDDSEPIRLQKLDLKPFKDSNSSITKLLAKPEAIAFGLLDKIGVRIVTNSLFDVFRVMQFLVKSHVVSYPHVVPGQTNNSLYPVDLFLEVMGRAKKLKVSTTKEIDELLKQEIEKGIASDRYLIKRNDFSSENYKFIKFINRQLVKVQLSESAKAISFFYPYEVQVIDYEHFLQTMTGDASHEKYKERQRAKARDRLFGIST